MRKRKVSLNLEQSRNVREPPPLFSFGLRTEGGYLGAYHLDRFITFHLRHPVHGENGSPQASTRDHANATLEPDRRSSLRFLGVSANWPGIVLVVVGALMMLWGAV